MTPRIKLSRRALLRGAGGVAIGLPLLGIMGRASRARGDTPPTPKRLVIFYSPNGYNMDGWPTSTTLTGTSFEPLAPYASKINLLRNFKMQSAYDDPSPNDGSHYNGWSNCLTGDYCWPNPADAAGRTGGNISFDIFTAQRIGGGTRFLTSLHGVKSENAAISWFGPDMPAIPDDSPQRVFTRLFSDLTADPAALDQVRLNRQSVLDYVRASTARLQCKLGSEDRMRLDEHLSAIRDVEARLFSGAAVGATCAVPDMPTGDPNSEANYPATGRAQTDLLVMALACDLTRVGSVQWTQAVGGLTPVWLGMTETHHSLSHETNDSGRAAIRQINTWYAEQMAYLLGKLDAVPEGDGTLLDNTVVVWVSEGADDGGHDRHLSTVVAGGAGGALQTGQFIDMGEMPHNNLWVELINAMSTPDMTPVTTFGRADSVQRRRPPDPRRLTPTTRKPSTDRYTRDPEPKASRGGGSGRTVRRPKHQPVTDAPPPPNVQREGRTCPPPPAQRGRCRPAR